MNKENIHIIVTVQFSPWSAYSGGAQQSAHNIALHLANNNYKVTVVYTKPWFDRIEIKEKIPYTIKWATYPGFKTKGRGFWRNLSPISTLFVIKKLIQESNYTIIHSNSEEGALLYRLKPKINKLIATVRYPSFPNKVGKERKTIFDKVSIFVNHLRYYLQGQTARRADMVTTPSQWAKETIISVFKLEQNKIQVINNGVPYEFQHYERNHLAAQNGPIVFFGRISPEKGLDILLHAYASLKNKKNKLLIIGDGPELSKAIQLSKKLEIWNDCTFTGWKSHVDLGTILSTAKMVCLPSLSENFSLAILSAMCVGVPVIATKAGGTAEIISNGQLGCLINEPNSGFLANAMHELMEIEKNILYGKLSRKHILDNFLWARITRKFEILYGIE